MDGHAPSGEPETCDSSSCVAARQRGDRWLSAHLSLDSNRICHFHHNSELQARVAEREAAEFAALAADYDQRPEDFVTAWNWLAHHPIFHRPLPHCPRQLLSDLDGEQLAAALAPDRFFTDVGLADMHVTVTRTDSGETAVCLEHGPYLWPADIDPQHWDSHLSDGTTTHDYRLDSVAATFEQAVIALAGSVRELYGHDRARVSSLNSAEQAAPTAEQQRAAGAHE